MVMNISTMIRCNLVVILAMLTSAFGSPTHAKHAILSESVKGSNLPSVIAEINNVSVTAATQTTNADSHTGSSSSSVNANSEDGQTTTSSLAANEDTSDLETIDRGCSDTNDDRHLNDTNYETESIGSVGIFSLSAIQKLKPRTKSFNLPKPDAR